MGVVGWGAFKLHKEGKFKMTVKELLQIFNTFIDNDFKHLRSKVDKLFLIIISGLITIVGGLLILILR